MSSDEESIKTGLSDQRLVNPSSSNDLGALDSQIFKAATTETIADLVPLRGDLITQNTNLEQARSAQQRVNNIAVEDIEDRRQQRQINDIRSHNEQTDSDVRRQMLHDDHEQDIKDREIKRDHLDAKFRHDLFWKSAYKTAELVAKFGAVIIGCYLLYNGQTKLGVSFLSAGFGYSALNVWRNPKRRDK